MIAGAVILEEAFYWNHFVGGSMILIGVYGTVWFGQIGKRSTSSKKLKLGEQFEKQ